MKKSTLHLIAAFLVEYIKLQYFFMACLQNTSSSFFHMIIFQEYDQLLINLRMQRETTSGKTGMYVYQSIRIFCVSIITCVGGS